MRKQLQYACEQGEIRLLDLHLGLFLEKQSTGGRSDHPSLLLAATLASAAVGHGHVCYPLGEMPEQPTLAELAEKNCPGP
ncbi:MAG: hypothetical protein D3914_17805, partial [Candidatus Electrothrix sp. LOE2]|nr:hypothetical protein [Candidatus Electrothrix sp. LOE2]